MSIVITLQEFFTCDGVDCRAIVTPEVLQYGETTVTRVNQLLARYERYALANDHDVPVTHVTSGYRTPLKNKSLPNAAVNSKHMSGQACDLYDPDFLLDDYCMDQLGVLERIGLWLEHPSATKGWCHVQSIPPRSGRRVFYP